MVLVNTINSDVTVWPNSLTRIGASNVPDTSPVQLLATLTPSGKRYGPGECVRRSRASTALLDNQALYVPGSPPADARVAQMESAPLKPPKLPVCNVLVTKIHLGAANVVASAMLE